MRIVQAITSMNHDLEQIDLRRQDLRQRRDRDLKDGVSAVELQHLAEQDAGLARLAADLRKNVAQLENLRQKQLAIFQDARRDREVLSQNRADRHRKYVQEQLRQDQKDLDDIFLSRFANQNK